MHIILQNAGKRFNREWIFRHLNYQFHSGERYAITGPNGSGKSTLLLLLAGTLHPSSGSIQYAANADSGPFIDNTVVHNSLSLTAPYLELIEEMTAAEHIQFHRKFKKMNATEKEILTATGLQKTGQKQIRYFSSGMKQRLKLALAFFSETPLLLLDEPFTNLDAEGIALFQSWIIEKTAGRTVIISSNDKEEYAGCSNILPITSFKQD